MKTRLLPSLCVVGAGVGGVSDLVAGGRHRPSTTATLLTLCPEPRLLRRLFDGDRGVASSSFCGRESMNFGTRGRSSFGGGVEGVWGRYGWEAVPCMTRSQESSLAGWSARDVKSTRHGRQERRREREKEGVREGQRCSKQRDSS